MTFKKKDKLKWIVYDITPNLLFSILLSGDEQNRLFKTSNSQVINDLNNKVIIQMNNSLYYYIYKFGYKLFLSLSYINILNIDQVRQTEWLTHRRQTVASSWYDYLCLAALNIIYVTLITLISIFICHAYSNLQDYAQAGLHLAWSMFNTSTLSSHHGDAYRKPIL